MVNQYVQNSKGHYKCELLDVFKVNRDGDNDRYNPNKLGNKMLLWHGSRFSNFVGILSQGLRIAPPEAPSTGYLFGKGVYLADMLEKSGAYTCYQLSNDTALLLLCETALGKPRELLHHDYDAARLPPTFDSTKGVGTQQPEPTANYMLDKDVIVPNGKVTQNPKGGIGHNEFIVYNVNQVKMRYLVKVKFN